MAFFYQRQRLLIQRERWGGRSHSTASSCQNGCVEPLQGRAPIEKVSIVSLDLAKSIIQVHAASVDGSVLFGGRFQARSCFEVESKRSPAPKLSTIVNISRLGAARGRWESTRRSNHFDTREAATESGAVRRPLRAADDK